MAFAIRQPRRHRREEGTDPRRRPVNRRFTPAPSGASFQIRFRPAGQSSSAEGVIVPLIGRDAMVMPRARASHSAIRQRRESAANRSYPCRPLPSRGDGHRVVETAIPRRSALADANEGAQANARVQLTTSARLSVRGLLAPCGQQSEFHWIGPPRFSLRKRRRSEHGSARLRGAPDRSVLGRRRPLRGCVSSGHSISRVVTRRLEFIPEALDGGQAVDGPLLNRDPLALHGEYALTDATLGLRCGSPSPP